MTWIKKTFLISITTLALFLSTDLLITWAYGSRGNSQFYEHNSIEGRINKPNFSGKFGSLTKPYSGHVTIGEYGERASLTDGCTPLKRILFLGDSTTAGFEVDDHETFVSLINSQCLKTKIQGVNLGVRGHDTHSVTGTYLRVKDILPHDIIVYLLTSNDYFENVSPDAYKNITNKFGRRYQDKIIPPRNSWIFKLYAKIRMFVGDRLSITTEAIVQIQSRIHKLYNYEAINANEIENKSDSKMMVDKSIELITNLANLRSDESILIYVISYPYLRPADSNQPELLQIDKDLNLELDKIKLPNLKYKNISPFIHEKLIADEATLGDMRYETDSHLSEYGHAVLSYAIYGALTSD